jgi:adenine-specific DNA-methyltransferase
MAKLQKLELTWIGMENQPRHETGKRKNVVPVGRAFYDRSTPKPKRYDYDPHLDSKLIWSGKKEDASFKVPMVLPHIHERIAPEAKLND